MAGISITLAGNFSKLDELKNKAQKTAADIKSAFGSNMGKAMFGGVAVASAAAFATVVASVKKAIDAGGELNDMMARTGAAGKGLLILQRAFENAGMAASQVAPVLNKLQKALTGVNEEGEPTNKAFEKLGLSIGELAGMDVGDALIKVGESIASIESPAQRTARVMEIFGKSGGELLAVFNDSSAFSSAREQLGALADILPEIAADTDTVGDSIDGLDDKMKQLGAGILKELLPMLLEVSKSINQADFVDLGRDIGEATTTAVEFVGVLAKVAEKLSYLPRKVFGFIPGKILGAAASMNPEKGTALPSEGLSIGADGKLVEAEKTKSAGGPTATPGGGKPRDDKSEVAAGNRAIEESKAMGQAAADKAAAAEKSRSAAAEEYKLEKAILAARIAGDADRLAKLEREKAIREEMARLTGAGFTAAEARKPAADKVDAEKKLTAKEEAAEARQDITDRLQGKLDDVRGRQQNHSFDSTIGKVSDMQRIGGGGGAVASGLNYARQAADLQRETNRILGEIREASRREVEA